MHEPGTPRSARNESADVGYGVLTGAVLARRPERFCEWNVDSLLVGLEAREQEEVVPYST
jgi:hypothetical protein